MEAKFSPRVKDVISFSREVALRLGHDYIGTEHLLLGLIREGEGMAIKVLKSMDVNLVELRKNIEQSIGSPVKKVNNQANIPLVKQAEKALKITYLEAKLFQSNVIGTEHLLLAILKDDDSVATKALAKLQVDYDSFKQQVDIYNGTGNPRAEAPGNPTDDDNDD